METVFFAQRVERPSEYLGCGEVENTDDRRRSTPDRGWVIPKCGGHRNAGKIVFFGGGGAQIA